jgi:hypothetical protein
VAGFRSTRSESEYATVFHPDTMNKFEADHRAAGWIFLPPRIEAGVSFAGAGGANAFGFHLAWQPASVP